jgi:ribosome biogenesis GTPase
MTELTLYDFGWNEERAAEFAAAADPDSIPGRVIGHERTALRVVTPGGVRPAMAAGRFRRRGRSGKRPVVGDWVMLSPVPGDERLAIRRILKRGPVLSRIASSRRNPAGGISGRPEEQVLSANVDLVFVMTALDDDFSTSRIERYIATVTSGGAKAVVLLTKADLAPAAAERAREVERDVPGAEVHVISSVTGEGVETVRSYLKPGVTAALIGSSGVGKSTLVNALVGEEIALTGEVRETDGKGRHTTTWRELFVLPGGGILIDNPGLREVGVWAGRVADSFADVEELARGCQFRDCQHVTEPNCAVLAAVKSGELSRQRYESYLQRSEEAGQVTQWLTESERRNRSGGR